MPLIKEQKQKIIDDLREKIAKQKAMIFVDFSGLKVKDLFNLRKKLKAAGNELKVAKKTLMDIVFKKGKLEVEPRKLPGEIALVFGYKDEISPAKIIWQFSQENPNLKILGGFFENKFLETEKVIELAKLPTREELLAKLVRSISSPMSNFVRILEANIKGLIYVLAKAKT